MNLKQINTIIEEPESGLSSPKNKDVNSFEELNYFTARDDQIPIEKDDGGSTNEKQTINLDAS